MNKLFNIVFGKTKYTISLYSRSLNHDYKEKYVCEMKFRNKFTRWAVEFSVRWPFPGSVVFYRTQRNEDVKA